MAPERPSAFAPAAALRSLLPPLLLSLALLLPTGTSAQQPMTWAAFTAANPTACSGLATDMCSIPAGMQVTLDHSVTVRSLWIHGHLSISPSGPGPIVVNSSFVVALGDTSLLQVSGSAWDRTITFYMMRNPASYGDNPHPSDPSAEMLTGGRVMAAWKGGKIDIAGLPLSRTWTLLTQDVWVFDDAICVSDPVSDWPIGSTIALSPTDFPANIFGNPYSRQDRVGAQRFTIVDRQPGNGAPCVPNSVKQPAQPCADTCLRLSGRVQGTPTTHVEGTFPLADVPVYQGSLPPVQGEVLLLNRTVIITGSDFSARWAGLPIPPWEATGPYAAVNHPDYKGKVTRGWMDPAWYPYYFSDFPGEGLHTLAIGECQPGGVDCHSAGGWMKVKYTRVEKAGQRGWIGRYPLHFHKMGDCPDCAFVGNAVLKSQQRGITIHSTHRSNVSGNVLFGVKGAGLYVEEGTEMENVIRENAVVCDVGISSYTIYNKATGLWDDAGIASNDTGQGTEFGGGGCQVSVQGFGDPYVQLGGCRITGTDNDQSDCAQQAGIWALSASNDFIGNRVSNHYNGIYLQSTLFSAGRLGTDSYGRVCPIHSSWGRFQGNVVHSNQRFGWYPDVNYPNDVHRSVASNGYVTDLVNDPQCTANLTDIAATCSCRPYTLPNGDMNGQVATTYEDGVDWGNGFVGQYDLANVQYLRFTSINNNWGMYWKGSANFRSKTASHIKDSTFQFGATGSGQYNTGCCGVWANGSAVQPCVPHFPQYALANWSKGGAAGISLVSLPGASATMVLENVTMRGVTTNAAAWLNSVPLKKDGGQGAALNINQQCKFFKGMTNPLGELGYDEGALCTPTVYLVRSTFDVFECSYEPYNGTFRPFAQWTKPVWINIGAANGNSYLGMVVSPDDSLCGGLLSPCPIRAVVPTVSTHLLDLPGNPCVLPSLTDTSARYGPDWFRRFTGNIICEVETRRFNIWGQNQGPLLLTPPGGARGWTMNWLGFGIPSGLGQCWGTECSVEEERRWAQGYGATVMSNEVLPGTWTLSRVDGQPVDLSMITMIEFSDEVFGLRFAADTMLLKVDSHATCVLSSTDPRLWMTQFGPVRRGGGSCLALLEGSSPPQPPLASPSPLAPGASPSTPTVPSPSGGNCRTYPNCLPLAPPCPTPGQPGNDPTGYFYCQAGPAVNQCKPFATGPTLPASCSQQCVFAPSGHATYIVCS